MSYFVAGIGVDKSLLESGKRAIHEMTIGGCYGDVFTALRGESYLANAPAKKTVQDLYWEDASTNSWLLVTGVPVLLKHSSKTQLGDFAKEYFSNPVEILRTAIDGHFGLIGYNGFQRKLYVATDINSFIPIYYASDSKGLYFSSSELILARHLQAPLDSLGVAQSLYLGATYDSSTRFKGIKKLRAAELIVGDMEDSIDHISYWSPSEEYQWKGSFDEIFNRWLSVLRKSVKRFPGESGEREISSDLTGGEDSRLIVSLCHDQKIPIRARVMGFKGDQDVFLATEIASEIGLPISVEEMSPMNPDSLYESASIISRRTDGYGSIFSAATTSKTVPTEYSTVNLCGTPGGNVYRGVYYWRARVLFPSCQRNIDYKLLLKMKFLFDYDPSLLTDSKFLDQLYSDVETKLKGLSGFPAGTKVDHIVRHLHVCTFGVNIKRPFYLPFGLRDMTRSIYQIPPHMKQGGRLTRACTEKLYPDIARLPTKDGVPTIRITPGRLPLFIPGYIARFRSIGSGILRRIFRVQKFERRNIVDAQHHRLEYHTDAINMFLRCEPYATWFSSADNMYISKLCNKAVLMNYFEEARRQSLSRVQLFGKLVNLELACRWVYGDLEAGVNSYTAKPRL